MTDKTKLVTANLFKALHSLEQNRVHAMARALLVAQPSLANEPATLNRNARALVRELDGDAVTLLAPDVRDTIQNALDILLPMQKHLPQPFTNQVIGQLQVLLKSRSTAPS